MAPPNDQQIVPAGDKQIVSIKGATIESMEKFLSDNSKADYIESNPDKYNAKELDEINGGLLTGMKSELKINEADFACHVTYFLLRAAKISTSASVEYKYEYEYLLKNQKYVVKDNWVFPLVRRLCKKFGRANPLRSYCATLSELYLIAAPMYNDLFRCKSFARKGLPPGKEYLGADFVSGGELHLDGNARAVVVTAAKMALERSVYSGKDNEVVNLLYFRM